jgi:hypothetical protein
MRLSVDGSIVAHVEDALNHTRNLVDEQVR